MDGMQTMVAKKHHTVHGGKEKHCHSVGRFAGNKAGGGNSQHHPGGNSDENLCDRFGRVFFGNRRGGDSKGHRNIDRVEYCRDSP